MGEFRMPSLGADMDAGRIVEWRVRPGDQVHRGDIVAVVDTDKADVEVEVFEDGVVAELLVTPGETVAVGTPLARLDPLPGAPAAPGPTPPAAPAPPPPAAPSPPPPAAPAPPPPAAPAPPTPAAPPPRSPVLRRLAAEVGVDTASVAGTGPGGAVTRADIEAAAARGAPPAISPRARRLATSLGIDLDDVVGHGPQGSVTGADVEAAAAARGIAPTTPTTPAAPAAAPPPPRGPERAAAMRDAIARRMSRSKREIPHYYLDTTIDFGPARAWLDVENEARPVTTRLLPAVLLLKAAARAARAVPECNGFWVDDELRPSDAVHLGVAISLRGGGLVAPAIHDADARTLDDLMAALRDLVTRARAGTLRSSEMSDPTITVTNLGEQGVERVFGVIYPPQVALVGFGAIVDRPWARDGMVGAHPVVSATLSGDHRASDGARGARLLRAIDSLLQEPDRL